MLNSFIDAIQLVPNVNIFAYKYLYSIKHIRIIWLDTIILLVPGILDYPFLDKNNREKIIIPSKRLKDIIRRWNIWMRLKFNV